MNCDDFYVFTFNGKVNIRIFIFPGKVKLYIHKYISLQ